jgi:hypothetical protein
VLLTKNFGFEGVKAEVITNFLVNINYLTYLYRE